MREGACGQLCAGSSVQAGRQATRWGVVVVVTDPLDSGVCRGEEVAPDAAHVRPGDATALVRHLRQQAARCQGRTEGGFGSVSEWMWGRGAMTSVAG